ncbi:MAG TPA: type 1 glutamine amidotransferase [Acidimicrobiales bacterium]|jgi:GMP synthase-like glutamine amidotransferase|nr:type 1 glutamine amidotransferase [Acidimicrobiales bacterium]
MTARVAFLQHSASDLPGVLGKRALQLGLATRTYRADHGPPGLPPPDSFDLLVVMGSVESATNHALAWIGPERQLVAEAAAAGIPVLGVCFGGQLLAQVLGGEVGRAIRPEIGWLEVETNDEARVPSGPWFVWHEDAFTTPPGADLVASTDVSGQAYVLGIHTGVQFHPEVTRGIVRHWVNEARAEDRIRPSEAEDLLAGFDAGGHGPDDQARRLFDGYLERAGLPI